MNNLGTIVARLVVLIAERAIAFLGEEVVELVPPYAKWLRFGVIASRGSFLLRLFNQFEPSLINLGLGRLRLIERASEIARRIYPVWTVNFCYTLAFCWTTEEIPFVSELSELVTITTEGSRIFELILGVGVACCKSDGDN